MKRELSIYFCRVTRFLTVLGRFPRRSGFGFRAADAVDLCLLIVVGFVETGQSKSQRDRRNQLAAVIEEKRGTTADGLTNVLDMDRERYSGRSYPGVSDVRTLPHQC